MCRKYSDHGDTATVCTINYAYLIKEYDKVSRRSKNESGENGKGSKIERRKMHSMQEAELQRKGKETRMGINDSNVTICDDREWRIDISDLMLEVAGGQTDEVMRRL